MKPLLYASAFLLSCSASQPTHKPFWYGLFEVTYFLLQGASAKIQAVRIAQNLPISHFWWAAAMVVIAGLMVISYRKLTHCRWKEALKLGASLLLIRFVGFTPWLNKLRGRKFFYLGKGSAMDRLMKGWYPWAWSGAVIGLAFLQIFKAYQQ